MTHVVIVVATPWLMELFLVCTQGQLFPMPFLLCGGWVHAERDLKFKTKGHVSCVLSVAVLLHCQTLCVQTHWLCGVKLCYDVKGLYNW